MRGGPDAGGGRTRPADPLLLVHVPNRVAVMDQRPGGVGRRLLRTRSGWARLLLGATSILLAGCSSSPHPQAATRSTTTTALDPTQKVLQAYAQAVKAIADAEVHDDANWPALAQTMVDPELEHVRAYITTEQGLDYHERGTSRIVRSEVSSSTPSQSVVRACVFDEVIAYQANGQPVPGNAGRATFGIERAVLIPSGSAWVLQDGTATQYPTAQQAGPLCVA